MADAAPRPGPSAGERCVIGEYCQRHGFIHGAEAEELRQRVETILNQVDHEGDDAAEALDRALRFMLDEIDARDSLAYREALADPPVAAPPPHSVETAERVARGELTWAQADRQSWLCGCGAWNGVNLTACGLCKRDRAESDCSHQVAVAAPPETPREFWMEVADIRTDDPLEVRLRETVQRVEAEGGCSELMTAVVIALGEAWITLKRRRLAAAPRPRPEEPQK